MKISPSLHRWLIRLSKITWVLLIVSWPIAYAIAFALPSFEAGVTGCYMTSALVGYVKCTGFDYAKAISFILNIPFLLMHSPIAIPFTFAALVMGHFRWGSLLYLAILFLAAYWPLAKLSARFKNKNKPPVDHENPQV